MWGACSAWNTDELPDEQHKPPAGLRVPEPADWHEAGNSAFGTSGRGQEGTRDGPEIFEERLEGRRERDGKTQERDAAQRQGREGRQGQEPQASHRHRPLRSAQEGQEGAEEGAGRPEKELTDDEGATGIKPVTPPV